MDNNAYVPPTLSVTNKSGAAANQDKIEIDVDEGFYDTPQQPQQQPPAQKTKPASKIRRPTIYSIKKSTIFKKTQAGHTKNPSKQVKKSIKKLHTVKDASHSKK